MSKLLKKESIQDYLLNQGIKPHFLGFIYLVDAINLYEEKISMTKVIYPKIAKNHNTTNSRVERAIRHAIVRSNVEKITNHNFIAISKLMLNREVEKDD